MKEFKYDHDAIARIKHQLKNFEVMKPGDDVIYYDTTRNEFKAKVETVWDDKKEYQPCSLILESGERIPCAIRTSYITKGRDIGMVTVRGYIEVKNYQPKPKAIILTDETTDTRTGKSTISKLL
ncbi:MAG: hypothetical protein V4547_19485 [Bacteroidota bacterium]